MAVTQVSFFSLPLLQWSASIELSAGSFQEIGIFNDAVTAALQYNKQAKFIDGAPLNVLPDKDMAVAAAKATVGSAVSANGNTKATSNVSGFGAGPYRVWSAFFARRSLAFCCRSTLA